MQVDAQKMNMLSSYVPTVMTLPVTLLICFVALFWFLSWTFFSGICVFAIAIFSNVMLSHCMATYQKAYMKKQDGRMNAVTECLNNIKMLKLYDWTELFLK